MKISEQFRAGKARLWRGRGVSGKHLRKSIPDALFLAERYTGRQTREAQWIVEDRLGYLSDFDWLLEQGVPLQEMTRTRLQQWRHAWLDQLIAEFEERGE